MTLYLIESTLSEISNKEQFQQLVDRVHSTDETTVLEVQVAKDFSRAYFILETDTEEAAKAVLESQNIQVDLVKEVRLVGKQLDELKANKEAVNYLVEWEIPAEITMDQYLARKEKFCTL